MFQLLSPSQLSTTVTSCVPSQVSDYYAAAKNYVQSEHTQPWKVLYLDLTREKECTCMQFNALKWDFQRRVKKQAAKSSADHMPCLCLEPNCSVSISHYKYFEAEMHTASLL